MAVAENNVLLNRVLIQMARSFLQYVAEGSPWVGSDAASVESQVRVLAARQRQNAAELAEFLSRREHAIDFGSFPTEYTDQQFLSLQALMGRLKHSQQAVCASIETALQKLRTSGDSEATELLTALDAHERNVLTGLQEIEPELAKSTASTIR